MTLFRTLDMVLVAVMICAAGITYKVKYDAQKRIAEVRHIERQIEAEHNTIKLLQADWALMTQPSRLQVLVERYQAQLQLDVITPRQIASVDEVPERLPDQIEKLINDTDIDDGSAILAGTRTRQVVGTDNIQTGSIGQ